MAGNHEGNPSEGFVDKRRFPWMGGECWAIVEVRSDVRGKVESAKLLKKQKKVVSFSIMQGLIAPTLPLDYIYVGESVFYCFCCNKKRCPRSAIFF